MRRARVLVAVSVAAGAVVLRIVPVVAVFFTATDAACKRGAGFFAAAAVEVVVAFLAPAPVRVGLMTVVPEEAVDPVLFLRSPCRVAGRGNGERVVLGPVAARFVGLEA